MVPTIKTVMKWYPVFAQSERMKTGRPSERTVCNTLTGVASVCTAAGIPLASSVARLTRPAIDTALSRYMMRGVARITAWSYVCQVRALFARWCLSYYRDAGWEITVPELPAFRVQAGRYLRPSAELLRRVRAWYANLDGPLWFAATMMLEFAMRNGDVMRLTDDNFVERGGKRYLSYTPHKTEMSSGRRVLWPVHETIWRQLSGSGGVKGLLVTHATFHALNAQLRRLGFRGTKASYELRKICIDHIYQHFGAELATSISGDDIKTITRYYADPAQPNAGAIRIIDLL